MPRYLISFDDGAMTCPREDLPDVARASHAVVDVPTQEDALASAAKIAAACRCAQEVRVFIDDPNA